MFASLFLIGLLQLMASHVVSKQAQRLKERSKVDLGIHPVLRAVLKSHKLIKGPLQVRTSVTPNH